MVLMYKPSVINAPSGRTPEKAPRWDLTDTKSYGGGIRVLALSLVVWGYVGIYRRKKYVGGATGGPRGWRARPGVVGAFPYLVASWKLLLHRVQVSWIMFVPKITLPKVSFRLDSI